MVQCEKHIATNNNNNNKKTRPCKELSLYFGVFTMHCNFVMKCNEKQLSLLLLIRFTSKMLLIFNVHTYTMRSKSSIGFVSSTSITIFIHKIIRRKNQTQTCVICFENVRQHEMNRQQMFIHCRFIILCVLPTPNKL